MKSLIKPGDYIKYGDYKHSSVMRVTYVEGDVIVGRNMNGHACSTFDRDVLAVAAGFAPVFVGEFTDLGSATEGNTQFVAVKWDNGRSERSERVEVNEALLWGEQEASDADR